MEPIDPGELSLHVKQRMDELFPDGDEPVPGGEARGEAFDDTLRRSKRIVQALEVRSQLDRLRAYLNELGRLRDVFSRDRHLRVLIQMQTAVCRYLLKNPRKLDGAGLALLSEGFHGIERLSAGAPVASSEKDRLARALVRDFHAWKEAVEGGEVGARAASGQGSRPAPGPGEAADGRAAASSGAAGAGAFYMIPVEDIDDLKRFFQREIVRLRKEVFDLLRPR